MSNRPPCVYYKQGKCAKGDQCKFQHSLCRYDAKCDNKDCQFLHSREPGATKNKPQGPARARGELPCRFFGTPNDCISGRTCPYLHEERPAQQTPASAATAGVPMAQNGTAASGLPAFRIPLHAPPATRLPVPPQPALPSPTKITPFLEDWLPQTVIPCTVGTKGSELGEPDNRITRELMSEPVIDRRGDQVSIAREGADEEEEEDDDDEKEDPNTDPVWRPAEVPEVDWCDGARKAIEAWLRENTKQ